MKAPDKIYLQKNTTTDCYGELWPEWFEGTHHPERDICYIRKDALLEWAKKEMGKWSSESTTAQGVKMGLTLVIDKIESLWHEKK